MSHPISIVYDTHMKFGNPFIMWPAGELEVSFAHSGQMNYVICGIQINYKFMYELHRMVQPLLIDIC